MSKEEAVRRLQAHVRRRQRNKSYNAKNTGFSIHKVIVKDTLNRPGKPYSQYLQFLSMSSQIPRSKQTD